jgi:flagellar biosynthesis/type III secretory pathway protein FliH
VFIGDRDYDPAIEGKAEDKLRQLFPLVALMTSSDGAKLIPIEEVFKMEQAHVQALTESGQKKYNDGYAEGHDKGLQEGLDEARRVIRSFDQAVNDAISQRAAMLEEARHKILDLVMQISKKVTFDALSLDPEKTAEIISRVIDQLVDKSRIKIKVHPDHLPHVEQNIDRFLSESVAIKELSIEADPRVQAGGCFIETPSGDVDARLSSQFDVIEQLIKSGEDEDSE